MYTCALWYGGLHFGAKESELPTYLGATVAKCGFRRCDRNRMDAIVPSGKPEAGNRVNNDSSQTNQGGKGVEDLHRAV